MALGTGDNPIRPNFIKFLSLQDYLSLFSYSSAQLSFFFWLAFSHLITAGFCELILSSSYRELSQVGQS